MTARHPAYRPAIMGTTLGALILVVGAAHAASFDCSRAVSPFEKAVCADSALSKADETLASTYRADRALLSAAGQGALRSSQRSWLAYATRLCRPGDTPLNAPRWSMYGRTPKTPEALVASCLEDTYRERQRLLGAAVAHLGGLTFLQTTTYQVQPARLPEYVKGPDAAHWIITTVQIDAPKTPAQAAWNAAISAALADASDHPGDEVSEDGSTDGDFTTRLVSASPDLISAELFTGTYGKGQAHGQYSSESQLFSLRSGRPLLAQDVFNHKVDWKAFLSQRTFNHLPAEWRKPEYMQAMSATAVDAHYWSFLQKGLQVRFDPYSVAGYNPPEPVLIPWSELRQVLRRELPFRPAELQALQ